MKSYLKTETKEFPIVGKLTITELSAGAQIALVDAYSDKKGSLSIGIICKHCVKEWRDNSVEEIIDSLPTEVLMQIADAVNLLSGVDASKNSPSVTEEDSSSD